MDNTFSITLPRSVAIEWRDSINEALGENNIKDQNFNSLQQLKAEIAALVKSGDYK